MSQLQLPHQVLHLDQHLMLLALLEAIQLQGQLQHQLQLQGQLQLLDLSRGIRLRLTYYALRCPELSLRSDEILSLHKLDQSALCDRLQQLGRNLDRVRNHNRT